MTKEELLLDTIKYYGEDTSRRNATQWTCRYAPMGNREQGCAIGRYLPLEVANRMDDISGPIEDFDLNEFEGVPEWMKAMDKDFLSDIQSLHDSDGLWDKDGLNKRGRMRVAEMIEVHELNITPEQLGFDI